MSEVKVKKKKSKNKLPKTIKVDKTIMKLWTLTEDGGIEQVKIPTNKRLDFIRKFGTLSIPNRSDVYNWLNIYA